MRLREEVTLTPIGAEWAVLLDERKGRYYQLNPTAYALLRLLLDGAAPEQAAARLVDWCPDAAGRAERDTAGLVAYLTGAGLLWDEG
ncbi:lasso peptide biosynthesis PqqD family chaperone [Nonomuraea sp. NPDC050404]|uniref:lasso peptide biosynthesis PqqD family chaperone n=1 Tax=Nonomuraea sp. NPDC050404 TaxID=3155783 RepID=UPI00341054B8